MNIAKACKFSVFIFLISGSVFSTELDISNLSGFYSKNNISSYYIDTNGDSIKDWVVTGETEQALYIIDSKNKILANATNFNVDGYSLFSEIKTRNDGKPGFVIIDVGGNFDATIKITIGYDKNNGYTLDHIDKYRTFNLSDKKISCHIDYGIPFDKDVYNKLSIEISLEKNDDFKKYCKKY